MKLFAVTLLILGLVAAMLYCVDRGHNWTAFALFIMSCSVRYKEKDGDQIV
jgi:hypothetical protein